MVATAIIGGGVLSAGASVFGSMNAADAQTQAAQAATAAQQQQQAQTRADLLPFKTAGQNALLGQQAMTNQGFQFNPTMQQLQQTPGYQFNLQQGLNATQNGAAARGLGLSGAAMQGASQYASGLAANTYQQQFNNALQGWQTNYNALSGLSNLGENAAAQTGAMGTQTATNIGNNLIGAGNAQAGAYMAGANGVSGAIGNSMNGLLMSRMLGQNGTSYNPASAGGLF